jgi:hypothetical protein
MATGSYAPPPPARTTVQPIPTPQPVMSQAMIRPRSAGTLVMIGIIFFFIGAVLVQSTVLMKSPEYDDFDDPEDYSKELEAYRDLRRNLFGFGRILNWVGVMIISLPLYLMGIASEGMDWKVRASMLSAGTALVIATMIVTMFITLF